MRISDWSSDVCSSDLVGDKGHDIARPQMGIWQFVGVNGIEREVRDLRRAIFGLRRRGQRPGANLAQDRHCLAIGVESGKRRSEEHTSELQSLMRLSYAFFCLKKPKCQIVDRRRQVMNKIIHS